MPGGGPRPPVDDLRLYRRHEFLRYWYVPVAAALAVLVAIGVIWGSDKLFGGGGDNPASPTATATPSESTTVTVTVTGTPPTPTTGTPTAGTQTPATVTGSPASGTRTPGATGPTGQTRVITGTGGDCLNIRTGPGTASPAVDCLAEGTVVQLAGETQESGGITWVRINTESGHDGWVSGEFLVAE
jgi:hypothetical protein